jgi:two-component system chemotaxis response regulator CheB
MREGQPPVVAIVCSAGGLPPLYAILESLPADLPAAVIVLRHQSPSHVSSLWRMLARHSTLPVHTTTQGELLRAGTVSVVPHGRHALVTSSGTMALIPAGPVPPNRPSADLLLTSMALSLGSQATAVILSGGGHDGATGGTAIHEFGGTVIAADRASSEFFSMPEAAIGRDEIVDHVAPAGQIAALLAKLLADGEADKAVPVEAGKPDGAPV